MWELFASVHKVFTKLNFVFELKVNRSKFQKTDSDWGYLTSDLVNKVM